MSDLPEINDDEYAALSELDPRTQEATVQFAVVYFRRGKRTAEGPFSERRIAEAKATANGGVIAERIVETDFGLWTPSDPRGHVR